MSVLGFAGAELGATAELSGVSGIAVDAAVVHGGRYSFLVSSGGSGTLLFSERSTPIYVRGYFRVPAGGVGTQTRLLAFRDGAGTANVGIELRGIDLIFQAVGFSGIGIGTTVIAMDTWHRMEVLVIQSTGYCEVRINGRQEIVATLGIPASIAQIAIMSSTGNAYWDDIHVTEDGWPGPGFVIARQGRPGTPTYDAFTKTGGTIDAIWSETPTNAATNAASTATGQTQTMLVDALSQVPIAAKYGAQRITTLDTILGAKIYAYGHRDAGSNDHYLVWANDGVITRSGPVNFTTLDTYRGTEMFPATLAQLDAMEIGGARSELTTVANLILNDLWLIVSYASAPVGMPHFTGFETGSLGEVTGVIGNVVIDTTQVRSGVYAAKGVGPSASFVMQPGPWEPSDVTRRLPLEADRIWVRGYVFLTALPPAAETILSLRDANRTTVVSALTRPSGAPRLQVGATLVNGVILGGFVVGAWNYVELSKRASVLPGDGVAELWVNDQYLTLPIIDTGGATTQALWEVRTNILTLWFDDLAMSETGRIGPGRVLARQGVSGTPINAAWSKVGGLIEAVWSNTPSNPATYAQALTVNSNQTMPVNPQANGGADLNPTDTIIACRIVAMARYDTGVSGGPTQLRVRGPGFTTQDTSVPITSTVSRLVYSDVFATVLTTLDTLQIGGRHGLSGSSLMRIEDIWLMVAYADLQILDLPLPSIPAPVAIVEIEL